MGRTDSRLAVYIRSGVQGEMSGQCCLASWHKPSSRHGSGPLSETVARRRPEGSALGVDAGLKPTGTCSRRPLPAIYPKGTYFVRMASAAFAHPCAACLIKRSRSMSARPRSGRSRDRLFISTKMAVLNGIAMTRHLFRNALYSIREMRILPL